MPLDTKALYYATDLGAKAETRLGLLETTLEIAYQSALQDYKSRQVEWVWEALQDNEAKARNSPLYPWLELAEIWNTKLDLEGIEYGFSQAQMVATGKDPWRWSLDDPAEAGVINVREWLNRLVAQADAILRRHAYVERDARKPIYEWNLETVRQESVEAFRETAADVLTPKGGWGISEKLAIAGVLVSVGLFLLKR